MLGHIFKDTEHNVGLENLFKKTAFFLKTHHMNNHIQFLQWGLVLLDRNDFPEWLHPK